MKASLVGGAIPEKGNGHPPLAFPLFLKGRTGGEGNAPAHDSIGPQESQSDIDHVQRAAFGPVVSVLAPVELGVHPGRIGASGKHVTVTAVGAGDHVAILKGGAYSHRHCFLADIGMQKPGNESLLTEVSRPFLEPADQKHGSIESGQPILVHAGAGHRLHARRVLTSLNGDDIETVGSAASGHGVVGVGMRRPGSGPRRDCRSR